MALRPVEGVEAGCALIYRGPTSGGAIAGPFQFDDRRLRPADHLCAHVGDRPLRPALPLLHGRDDDVRAARRDASRFEEIVELADMLHRARRPRDPPDRRRAAGAARGSRSRAANSDAHRARPRRADHDDQRHAARAVMPPSAVPTRASGGSMSASTAATPSASATSPGAASSRRCWRHRAAASGRARDQDQHGRAQGAQRGRDRADAALVRERGAST